MRTFTFTEELEGADSVLGLAARLGRLCSSHESELGLMVGDEDRAFLCAALTTAVEGSEVESWEAVIKKPDKLKAILGQDLAELVERTDIHHPLECLGVLRGLCRGVLPRIFADARGRIPLEEGTPVPFPDSQKIERPFEMTPLQTTMNTTELLSGYGHRLFEYKAGENVRVALDYSRRARLDELCWKEGRGFPRIATIHPDGCGEIAPNWTSPTEFFDVEPERWDSDRALALLARAAEEAEIAVLPELSLPDSAALEEALTGESGRFPPLVIAGSAHLRERPEQGPEVRANEARIYLDCELIGAHRKCHPYPVRSFRGKRLPAMLTEALSPEPKTIVVYAGEHSRFAVVICADLTDDRIPQKLLAAGVSTLIAPSYTPKKGNFNGPIADLASRRQGIAVIANAPPIGAPTPFHLMVAAPRPDPADQTTTFPLAGETPTEIALFDPNKDFPEAITWLDAEGN